MKTLKEKLIALRLYIVRRSYSLWHGVKFESGFEYQSIKILPVNKLGLYRGNGFMIPIKPNFELGEADFTLYMYAFNTDDTYQHIISAYINITIQAGKTFQLLQGVLSGDLVPGLSGR